MGLFGGETSRDELIRLEARVAALEATVARLTGGLGAVPAPVVTGSALSGPGAAAGVEPWAAEARSLKDAGQAIAAIKLVRERTGCGLKEAKDLVDRL
ncbi:ribosomal protein L7/L12 [Nocardioides sp.]|uniref:ribosomal protein L7/L12 n=1 Tax=Nocardioides sp. TaxID=35761 RepID=UPI00352800A3